MKKRELSDNIPEGAAYHALGSTPVHSGPKGKMSALPDRTPRQSVEDLVASMKITPAPKAAPGGFQFDASAPEALVGDGPASAMLLKEIGEKVDYLLGRGGDFIAPSPDPVVINRPTSVETQKHLFELYDRGSLTFRVRGCEGKEVQSGGSWLSVSVGTAGYGLDGAGGDITISASSDDIWVWIELNKQDSGDSATLEVGTTLEASSESTEVYPLAFVPMTGTAPNKTIDWTNVVQARSCTIHWLGE